MDVPSNLVNSITLWSRTKPSNQKVSTELSWDDETDKEIALNQFKEHYPKGIKPRNWLINQKEYCFYHGLAQGSPLSPTLSTILLVPNLMLNPLYKIIFYADDGDLYDLKNGVDPIEILKRIDKRSGIKAHLNLPKTGWNKENEIWLRYYKMLGKRFEPNDLHPTASGDKLQQKRTLRSVKKAVE